MTDQQLFLLNKSTELFMRNGVKSITMDEVARELGMSKKTIYRFVENKADLIKLAMTKYLDDERAHLESILKSSKDSVDEMIQMITYFFNQVHELDATSLADIQKYYPEAWNIYNDYRYNYSLGLIKENMRKGMEQGVYRNDINSDVISKIYISAIDILIDQNLFPTKNYAFIDVYKEFLNYHLRGIVSVKGLKHLETHNLFKK